MLVQPLALILALSRASAPLSIAPPPAPPPAPPQTVTVIATDYHFAIPATLAAGTHTLTFPAAYTAKLWDVRDQPAVTLSLDGVSLAGAAQRLADRIRLTDAIGQQAGAALRLVHRRDAELSERGDDGRVGARRVAPDGA